MVANSSAIRLTEGCEPASPIDEISQFMAEQLRAAGVLLKAMEPGLRCALRPENQALSKMDRDAVDHALQVHDLLSQRIAKLAKFAAEARGEMSVADVERILGLDSLIQAWKGEADVSQPDFEMF